METSGLIEPGPRREVLIHGMIVNLENSEPLAWSFEDCRLAFDSGGALFTIFDVEPDLQVNADAILRTSPSPTAHSPVPPARP
jgi:hypothetical protein